MAQIFPGPARAKKTPRSAPQKWCVTSEGQRRLRELRLDLRSLASAIGCSRMGASRYLRGVKVPEQEIRRAIEQCYGIPTGLWLVQPASPLTPEAAAGGDTAWTRMPAPEPVQPKPAPTSAQAPRTALDDYYEAGLAPIDDDLANELLALPSGLPWLISELQALALAL